MPFAKNSIILIQIFLTLSSVHANVATPAIAVIGAGIGGTSVSYFLKELFEDEDIEIDVYESKKVGGRLATIDIDGLVYEVGGSVIHPDNRYMSHFCKKFDLHKKEVGNSSHVFGLYDGNGIVFEESPHYIVTMIKMLWRYGLNPLTLSKKVERMLSKFMRVYDLQDRGMTYSTVEELLKSINPDFIEDVQISTAEGFAKAGLSNRTISELVMAGLIVNYGQTTAAHKFVGSVSSATGDGNLWSIVGGNKLLPEKLLKYSGATLINAKVEKIKWDEQYEQYLVSYYVDRFAHRENKSDRNITLTDKNLVTKVYDIVIVAAPLTRDTSNIVFEKLPSLTFVPDGRYHRTVCTIVKGKLNHRYFGERNEANEIYSIKDNLLINSVARIYSVHKRPRKGESEVWKVFSQKPLSKDDLSEMFLRLIDVKVVDWLAYPHYDSNQTLGSFVLSKNLYHVNAIEWAASAMEMSVIGAKNVALLAYKNWRGVNVDNSEKDEL